MKNKITLAFATFFTVASFQGYAAEDMTVKTLELQIRRLDDIVRRIREENDRLKRDMRTLQRHVDKLEETNDKTQKKANDLQDEILKIGNTQIANLKANQQKLYDNYGILNWGTEKRDCEGLGKHQQIKVTQSNDGNYTLRYLCYDGRALHLGTEVHQPPE
ncbi:MAG: hypothetical protein OXR68_06015 [Alphaproteobacteria bacterium]|nr:hypothetical protein [Alphaproteobacteria bacterium]MDD9920160.1 hypothetical protein [Alphaproteobacteria bacterium]